MISGAQIRAARAMLRWSIPDLASMAGCHPNTVARIENDRPATDETLHAIRAVLEAAGIQFIPQNGGGVGLRYRSPTQVKPPGTE